MEQQLSQVLAKQWILTEPEKEEYILTTAEEDVAILNEITRKTDHLRWKMKGLGYNDTQIGEKISQIDWSKEINREQILMTSNSAKHQDLWHSQRRKEEREREQKEFHELRERCTAKYMFNLMKWTSRNELGKDLIVNNDNTPLVKALCFFLSNDPRFETELGYSFQKGIIIRGVAGLGKTHLVKCLKRNELNPILILSMLEIADEVKAEGEYAIQLGNNKMIYLDDVGTEEHTVNHYGTKVNWFKNFIEMYYLRNKIYNKLIISTNKNFSGIEESYGFRVRSRMKDMFNVVDVTGTDMRGTL